MTASTAYKFDIFWAISPTYQGNTCNFKVEIGTQSIVEGPIGAANSGYNYQEFAQPFTAQSAAESISISIKCPSASDALDFYFDDISIIPTASGVTTICAETPDSNQGSGSGDGSNPGSGTGNTPVCAGPNLIDDPSLEQNAEDALADMYEWYYWIVKPNNLAYRYDPHEAEIPSVSHSGDYFL